ncbi:unnamed protein product [Microthlaspi erraticum]|uniref:Uncharacterized protein n=1 Tax=Microthlaspi erraticum TaxID=1685480 RepID=A0A6D2KWI1_9BRAS|nr:unnamed protein product [Microthlaspi erraticum]
MSESSSFHGYYSNNCKIKHCFRSTKTIRTVFSARKKISISKAGNRCALLGGCRGIKRKLIQFEVAKSGSIKGRISRCAQFPCSIQQCAHIGVLNPQLLNVVQGSINLIEDQEIPRNRGIEIPSESNTADKKAHTGIQTVLSGESSPLFSG